jgi:hypothetical protein
MVARNYSLGTSTKHAFMINAFFKQRYFFEQQKWEILSLVEATDFVSYDGDCALTVLKHPVNNECQALLNIPKLCFKCYACRRPFYYYADAYGSIFLITLATINIFTFDCKQTQNRLLSTFSPLFLFALLLLQSVSFKWVVNRSLPAVSYTTSLDQYSIICFLYLCLLFVWHSIVGSFWTKSLAIEIDKWVLLAFCCLFILIQFYFFFKAFKRYLNVCSLEKRAKSGKSSKKACS